MPTINAQGKTQYAAGETLPVVGSSEYLAAQNNIAPPPVNPTGGAMVNQPVPTPTPIVSPTPAQTSGVTPSAKTTTTETPTSLDAYTKATNDNNLITDQLNQNAQRIFTQFQQGTVPLNAYETAQVSATQASFQAIIDKQILANKNYEGGVTVQNENMGLSRYSPTMAAGTIFAAVSEGNSKVADLNVKMNLAVSTMQQGFQESNYKQVKESYDTLIAAQKEKTAEIEKMYTVAKAQEDQAKVAQQEETLNTAYQFLYDSDLPIEERQKNIAQLLANGDLSSAQLKDLQSGIDSLTKNEFGTGTIGEYNFYKKDMTSQGLTPLSFDEYQNRDVNRKISIAKAANAYGLTPATISTALKLSDDYEARSKEYYTQRDAYNRVVSSASDPSAAGDLALIFNYMKTLDPGSTVREGEFATAQNSGSAFQIIGAKYNKVMSGERLTQTQRDDFVKRAGMIFAGSQKQQESVAKEFEARATKYGVPSDLVVRDVNATGNAAPTITPEVAKESVSTVARGFPAGSVERENIAKMLEVPGATYESVYADLKARGIIK